MNLTIDIMREDWADTHVPLPSYASAGAVGADLRANLSAEDRADGITLSPGERQVIPTGLRVAIPEGYEMQIRSRSGLAVTHGVTVANSPGTIDCDYRGPLGVILMNVGPKAYHIGHGTRIAQAVISPVMRGEYTVVQSLTPTVRGSGGFGSTGTA